jgi:D-glycero-D-manno-heptose 1,7-bisphosphate phosphatase
MKKVIFIDRDGVINRDPGGWTQHDYVTSWEDFYFLPGVKEALKILNKKGYDVIIISNQAGISKGYYTNRKLTEITSKMVKEIKDAGGRIRKVYYCVHQNSDRCACRKPKTGMFHRAEEELGVKAAGAYFIGDGRFDIEAGRKASMKTVLVLSGKTDPVKAKELEIKPDYIFEDLLEVVNFIVNKKTERKEA